MEDMDKLYSERFEGQLHRKNRIWKILCKSFFQKFISERDTVLDIGAGYCEFINNISCGRKYAADLNQDTRKFAETNVEVFIAPSTDISPLDDSSVDVVFMSNFLEHLKRKADVLETLRETFRVLKPNGKVMILQPNIRYAI